MGYNRHTLSAVKRRSQRPSPSASAAEQRLGTKMTGNDGKRWVVAQNSLGVRRWVRDTTAKKSTTKRKSAKRKSSKRKSSVKRKSSTKRKTTKRKTNSRRFLNMSEIARQMPADYHENLYQKGPTVSAAKKVYGSKVHPLTLSLARTLYGQELYMLMGQGWYGAMEEKWTKDARKDAILKREIVGPGDDPNTVKIRWRSGSGKAYTYVAFMDKKNHPQGLVTGSGSDPIYIFKR
ncbi:hypothetical protein HK102_002471 [Quaeritorhiza haematococci]|nr:hypothetical protein HK102_002471 [Quaeritorhiza haematococci]